MEHIKTNLNFFLDDGFMFMDEDIISHTDLLNELSIMHPSIQYTMDTSHTRILFLGVLIIKHGEKSITDLHTKSTDTFNYYPFHSSGPRHIARNIPYNLARRIATIVSVPEIQKARLEELKHKLLNKNTPSL